MMPADSRHFRWRIARQIYCAPLAPILLATPTLLRHFHYSTLFDELFIIIILRRHYFADCNVLCDAAAPSACSVLARCRRLRERLRYTITSICAIIFESYFHPLYFAAFAFHYAALPPRLWGDSLRWPLYAMRSERRRRRWRHAWRCDTGEERREAQMRGRPGRQSAARQSHAKEERQCWPHRTLSDDARGEDATRAKQAQRTRIFGPGDRPFIFFRERVKYLCYRKERRAFRHRHVPPLPPSSEYVVQPR